MYILNMLYMLYISIYHMTKYTEKFAVTFNVAKLTKK